MKKMNMVEKFGAIKAMLNGESVENFSIEQAIEFIDGRIEQVEKKNAAGGGERKPTKTQIANEGIKETIVAVLRESVEPMTIDSMQKASAELVEYKNQKISALLTQLIKANIVVRSEVKGKAHFALAE